MDSKDLIDILDEQASLVEEAVDCIAAAMQDGARHGYQGNWLKQSCSTHLDHAIIHLLKAKIGEDSERHVCHAICRMVMMSLLSREYGTDYSRDGSSGDSSDERRSNVDGEGEKGVSEGEQEEGTVDWQERFRRDGTTWPVPILSPRTWLGDNS